MIRSTPKPLLSAVVAAALLALSASAFSEIVANTPPVAEAGLAQKVLPGAMVTVNGVASSDADSDPLTYLWVLAAKPAGSAAVLSNATSQAATFVADVAGSYTARLVVRDGKVNSRPDFVTILANTPPLANAGVDQRVPHGALVTLNGTASSDAESSPLTYKWTLVSKPASSTAALSAANVASPTFTADQTGPYLARLVVNDGKLNSAIDVVKISAAAPPPIELAANGGFEIAPAVAGQFALGWRGVSTFPATLSNIRRVGLHSALLEVPDPGFGGSGIAGNSVDDGGKLPILGLHVGKTPVLTFWAKGNASQTGNVNFSLRYLNANGNILNTVVNKQFQGQINPTTWTKISYIGPAIPALTSAMFLEMTLAVGPTGVQPPGNCGVDPQGNPNPCDYGQAKVWIDGISITVNP